MKISRISMIGNELPLSEMIKSQNRNLFDEIHLTFHNSFDGTYEILKSHPNTQIRFNDSKGYPQSQITNKMLQDAFSEGADVCIPLDSDEFLPFSERNQLENFLGQHIEGFDYIEIFWRNCIPDPFPLSPNAKNLKYAHHHAKTKKVIVFRSAYEKDSNLQLSQGSHLLLSNKKLVSNLVNDTFIIHIPFRSELHFAQKVLQGSAVMFEENKHDLSDQWIDGAKNPFISQSDLAKIALDYGDKSCTAHPILFNQELVFESGMQFIEINEMKSFNIVMQQIWPKINEMLASVPDTSYNALELRQMKRRLDKFKLRNVIILKLKQLILRRK